MCAALAALPALSVDLLGSAGLALPAVAVVFAVFVGVPLARADWSEDPEDDRLDVLARGLADTALFGSVAVGLASWLPAGYGIVGALTVWAFALLLRFAGPRLALLSLAGWSAILGASGLVALQAPPWSLLEPASDVWTTWLSTALGIGALASWGAGQWSSAAPPQPGRSGLPATSAGLALLALLAASVALGSGYEATLAARIPTLVALGFVLAGVFGAFAVLLRTPAGLAPLGVAGGGVFATLWFLGPAASTHWAWWSAELPLLLGLVSAVHAYRRRDVRAGVAAALLLGSVGVSFPGLPDLVLPAAATVVPLVGAVWFAGTRAILRTTGATG